MDTDEHNVSTHNGDGRQGGLERMRCQLQEARGLCFENLVVLASFDTTLLHSPFISFILITIIVGPVCVHSTNTTTAISSHNSHNSRNNISTKSS
jgi:hypothetical protein